MLASVFTVALSIYDRAKNKKKKKKKNSYIALYPVKKYELAALYIINIKIYLTVAKAQVLQMHTSIST